MWEFHIAYGPTLFDYLLVFFCSVCLSDTVNGFSFHPFLPMAASSSGHRRFVVPDDGNGDLHLSGKFIFITDL